MARRSWWLAGLAMVLIVAAACSGSDNKSSGSTSASGSTAGGRQSVAATAAAGPPQARTGTTNEADKAAPAQGGAAAPAQGQQQGQQAPGSTQVPGNDRMIIYNVTLDLLLKDVRAGFDRITQIAVANGGLIADSNVRQEGDVTKGSVTIRVPTDRYLNVLSDIRGLGKVEAEKSTANDITEEFTDLQSRQRALEATEAQLMELLKRANNVGEVLTVQDKLNAVRADIEKVRGRQNLYSRQSSYATIAMNIKPEPPAVSKFRGSSGGLWAAVTEPDGSAATALQNGWDASTVVLGSVALAVLTVAAFGWWLVPVLVLAYVLLRRELRRRAAMAPAAGTLPPPAAATGGAP
jgi:hypothetical protein